MARPRLSKVIASVMIVALTAIAGLLWQSFGAFLLSTSPIAHWLLGLLILITLSQALILSAKPTKRRNAPAVPGDATAAASSDGPEDKIQITFPRPAEILSDPQPLGDTVSYPVRGRLKSLSEGEEIWLLTANERSNQFSPQGFEAGVVLFDENTGEWHGRVARPGASPFRIFAVVAPPSAQDLFRYYQQRGDATGQYVPLNRIPPECRNACSVQARLQ